MQVKVKKGDGEELVQAALATLTESTEEVYEFRHCVCADFIKVNHKITEVDSVAVYAVTENYVWTLHEVNVPVYKDGAIIRGAHQPVLIGVVSPEKVDSCYEEDWQKVIYINREWRL